MPSDGAKGNLSAMGVDPFAAAVVGLVAAQRVEVPAYTQRAMG